MAIGTYAELLTAVGNWLNRSDLGDRIPEFIALFEARMNRLIRTPEMESTAYTSTSSATVALPSDFLSVREVYINAATDTVLEPMSPSGLRARYPEATSGTPAAYAISGAGLVLGPPPSSAVTLTINYFEKIPALTASNTTNWLLTSYPDAYLYGTLAQASAFIDSPDEIAKWKSAWDECVGEIMAHSARKRVPAHPLAMRPLVSE